MQWIWRELGSGSLGKGWPWYEAPPAAAGTTCHTQTANNVMYLSQIGFQKMFDIQHRMKMVKNTSRKDKMVARMEMLVVAIKLEKVARGLNRCGVAAHRGWNIRKWGSDLLFPLISPVCTCELFFSSSKPSCHSSTTKHIDSFVNFFWAANWIWN